MNNIKDLTKSALKYNTLNQVHQHKVNEEEINKEAIKASNQEIKDKSKQIAIETAEQRQQQELIDIYTETAKNNSYNTNENEKKEPVIYNFDPQAVNETRKKHQAISIYQNILNDKLNTRHNDGQILSLDV